MFERDEFLTNEFLPEYAGGRRHRFFGVRPDGDGWAAVINVPGGNTERLGVWGFEIDAAIARNVWLAYWGEDYYNRKYNAITEQWCHD